MIDYSKYNYSDEEGYTLKKEYQNQKTKRKPTFINRFSDFDIHF